MPTISSIYQNLARQGITKSFTHGYAQSVVAVTHPSSYSNQHRSSFSRRPSRLGKLSSYQCQNAFHNASSANAVVQDTRADKAVNSHAGLDAYFEAWNTQNAAGEEKEWTQFQFAKRIEWKQPAPAVEELFSNSTRDNNAPTHSNIRIQRSHSTSRLDSLKEAVNIAGDDAIASEVDAAVNGELKAYQDAAYQQPTSDTARISTPSLEETRSLTQTPESKSQHSPATSATSISTTADLQSQSYAEHLAKLADSKRYAEVAAVFEAMLVAGIQPTSTAYNALLKAAIHFPGIEHVQIVPKALDVYSDMLRRKVAPDTEIYTTLFNLVATRSLEISAAKKLLEEKRIRYGGMEEKGKFMFASNELEFDILSEEDRLDLAIKLFNTSTSGRTGRWEFYPAETYHQLISACAQAGRVPDMARLFEHMERGKVIPLAATFTNMIDAFAATGDLRSAVECYNEYKAYAVAHDNSKIELVDRLDSAVYAAVVKSYVKSERLEGAIKFYNRILEAYASEGTLRDVIVSRGFVQGFLDRRAFPEALTWAEGLGSLTKASAMNKIAIAAADDGHTSIAASAFSHVPEAFEDIAESATALLAMSVRQGDVPNAARYWHILASPTSMVTPALIEPTAMFAVALIGSGQVAEGLTTAEQMFARIKAVAPEAKDEIDEGIHFVSHYMAKRGIIDPRSVVDPSPIYQTHFTPAQHPAALVQPSYENSFDPYASSTDFKGSALIIDELERGNGARGKVSRLNEALTRFRNIRRVGRHPRYIVYAKLISAAAREDRMNLVHDILGMARTDVPLLPEYAVVKYGWASILDAMVGACLTLGNRTLAGQYHQELLQMGSSPSANTFGLYITTLKDSAKTFDEATEAVKIFQRAKAEGVEPSSFLYNALIGKLGKARRIDDCLFYFAEMRAMNVKPTSVTYGTIVNALCRVSDEKFAEELFDEMEAMPNYKARPAPYNSLMQFFLTTKRDKSKVLAYYERMKSNGIQPTNHTYKLLVDAHATLEPVNMAAAEAVLDVIRSTGQKPEAVHYASLIHAKGCVLHDLPSARAVFDSVLSDPTIRPQACLYQALFEAMVANHCVNETESILEHMTSRNVAMTPYIANTLIHGWANEKNIEKAQSVFATVSHGDREPSTYEAMTRAYLAVEDRPSAQGVVQEMLSRGYPSAVSSKILELLGGGFAEVSF